MLLSSFSNSSRPFIGMILEEVKEELIENILDIGKFETDYNPALLLMAYSTDVLKKV